MHTLTHTCTHTHMIKGVHATRLDWKRLGKASMVGVINVGASCSCHVMLVGHKWLASSRWSTGLVTVRVKRVCCS